MWRNISVECAGEKLGKRLTYIYEKLAASDDFSSEERVMVLRLEACFFVQVPLKTRM